MKKINLSVIIIYFLIFLIKNINFISSTPINIIQEDSGDKNINFNYLDNSGDSSSSSSGSGHDSTNNFGSSGSSSDGPTQYQCNENIVVKDWGFKDLRNTYLSGENITFTGFNNSNININSEYWLLDFGVGGWDVSFVKQLKEYFFTTDVVGYYAVRFEYGGSEADMLSPFITFNQTIEILPNTSYSISFRVSTTLSNFDINVYLDGETVDHIPPSQNTFDRSTYQIDYESVHDEPKRQVLSIIFDMGGATSMPIIYIENISILKLINEPPSGDINTIFVSNKGSDVYGDGSASNPFSSIQQAVVYTGSNGKGTLLMIYVLPGFYCGMGNSYLDLSSVTHIIIESFDKLEKPILSGEYDLIQVDFTSFSFGDAINITFNGFQFIESSNRTVGGGSININGNCSVTFIECDFDRHYGLSVVSINYIEYAVFLNCTFTRNTQYAIQSIGVFGGYTLEVAYCQFNSLNSLNLLNIDTVAISDSQFYFDPTEILDANQCPMVFDKVYELSFTYSTIRTSICAYRTAFYGASLTFYGQPPKIYEQTSILALNTDTALFNCYFGHYLTQNAISAFNGNLNVTDTIFNATMTTVSIQVESIKLYIENVLFYHEVTSVVASSTTGILYNVTAEKTVQMMLLTKSNFLIENSKIEKNEASNFIVQSKVQTVNCTFCFSLYGQPTFVITTSTYKDFGSMVNENSGSFILSTGTSSVYLNSTYAALNSYNIIGMSEYGTALIENSSFYSNTGSIVSMQQYCNLTVISTKFYSNTGGNGAVVYLSGLSNVTFLNVDAKGNVADGNGGVICSDSSLGNINVIDSLVTENVAGGLGSFIYYYGMAPNLTNTHYGPDQTVVLGQIFMNLTTNFPKTLQSGIGDYTINITFVNNKHVPLKNYKFEKSKRLFVTLGSKYLLSLSLSQSDSTGPISIALPPLIGQINSKQTIYISSDSQTITSSKIPITFDPCLNGFYPNEQNTLCEPCPYSTYGTDGETCEVCPANAVCFGGNNIAGEDGYWVDISDDYTVYQCPAGVCFLNTTSFSTSCAEFSTGILCASCEEGYYNCGSGCKQETSINKLVLISKIITFIVLVVIQQLSNDESALVPISIYFLQTLVVISSGIKFSILNLLSGGGSAHAGKSDGILSFLSDCIGPFGFYWNHYFVILQPVFLLSILGVIILLEYSLRKTKIIFKIPLIKEIIEKTDVEFRNRQFSAFVKVCMNSYGFGSFATEVLLILFCDQVGSNWILNANPEVQCSGDAYETAKKISYGLISILAILPILVFVLLYRHKDKLDDKHVERKLGVFYLKYIPKFYFWDALLLLKRFSIVIISLLPFESKFRSISLVTLSLAYLFIHLKYQPFVTDQDNNLETVSLILLFISCIYLDNGLYQDTEQYILIICIVIFVIAAIKLQSKYLVNLVLPILQTIWTKLTNSNPSSEKDDEYRVIYNNYGDEDDNEDLQYSYDSVRNLIKEVDKKGTHYNFSKNSNNNNNNNNILESSLSSSSFTFIHDDDDDDDDPVFSQSIKRRI